MRNYSNIFEILQSLRHQLKTAKVFLPQPVSKSEKGYGFYIRWFLISRCARMMITRSFLEKIIRFNDSFDVTKCLQQIEMLILLHVCAQ